VREIPVTAFPAPVDESGLFQISYQLSNFSGRE
jgi:hypothetical protein